ncbi:hypothetical protein ACSQ67_003150 [Phaseolus vulgaris]
MAKNNVKLLGGWFSPFALRVQIALNLKGVDYEVIEETLNPKSELLLKSNPVQKKIPVLLHADKVICESAIIVEYIDEVWTNAPPILPQNAYDRANARFWNAYIDEKWFTSLRSVVVAEDDEEKRPHFEQAEEVLESFLSWIRVTEQINGRKLLDETKHPSLVQWAETFAAHPAVNGFLPETDKLIEFAKFLKLKFAAK